MICYLAACLLAAAAPLMAMGPKLVGSAASVPVWPTQFRGRPLQPVGLKDYERRFAETLPGHLAKFTDGTRQYMFQWVSASNHLLHSATDCMASAGFTIAPQPLWVDEEGNRWSCALARRGPNSVRVYERIVDAAGHDWQDVSAWYWATLLGKTHTPWWMITILESIADEAREQTRSDPAKPADQSSPLGSTVLRNRREVPRPMDGCDNPDDLFQNSSLIDSMSQSSISPQSAASSPFLTSRSI
jgi:hypothetical protein